MRTASAADVGLIAGLQVESWRDAYGGILDAGYLSGPIERERLAFWTARLARPTPSERAIVAEAGGRAAGFAFAVAGDGARWGTLIDSIQVRPCSKNRGVGSLLMRAVAGWSLGIHPGAGLHLWCYERNAAAIRFYEGRGGAIRDRTLYEPPGGGSAPCVLLHWPDPGALLGPTR